MHLAEETFRAAIQEYEVIIHWDQKLSVGNDLIDQQHRMMMMLCRKLDIAIKTEQPAETIDFVIHELRGFTEFHFFSEENVMRERPCERTRRLCSSSRIQAVQPQVLLQRSPL